MGKEGGLFGAHGDDMQAAARLWSARQASRQRSEPGVWVGVEGPEESGVVPSS